MSRVFDTQVWAAVPFHFWSLAFFTFGSIVGSFLNVCIYRMPRGQSLVTPRSHCPHCRYSIPWHLNIPLLTWLLLRGRCANCGAPIAIRYFGVELLTAAAFLGSWLAVGRASAPLAVVYCLLLAGFIVATFIDFEHFIIPDEITLGGIVLGFLCSLAVPALHGAPNAAESMKQSFFGIVAGGGVIYAILRIGKLVFGKQKLDLAPDTTVVFTETAVVLPDREVLYEDLFYRDSDVITLEAKLVELIDRCYRGVRVQLSAGKLVIGEEVLDPETVPHMEVVTDKLVLPREAMGLGDVKFMAAIGAFLGWKAALFSLMFSSIIGATVGVVLIALKKQAWSSRLPYGPYIALAATFWIFGGQRLVAWWLGGAWVR
jgi:leader peptidase (prepilin peptidase)/N-methyltransferase